MTQSILRIATRESPLALWQAEQVAATLRSAHRGLHVELVPMTTRGDVYATMLYEFENNPARHYPKIVRFTSKDGGLTASYGRLE